MKKRILLLSSSPRRHGNSDRLCDEFLRGAREAGHDAEKISLRDCRIGYCTGCGVCVETCPAKEKALVMRPLEEQMPQQKNWDYITKHIGYKQVVDKTKSVKNLQFAQPLFEFSGACAGCGETPYIKAISQLFGDKMMVANATGCTSIYSGSAPSTPYCTNDKGQGPAWANSLFEDNAEFGLGMHLGVEKLRDRIQNTMEQAIANCTKCSDELKGVMQEWIASRGSSAKSAEVSARLVPMMEACGCDYCKDILEMKDWLVKKSQWIIGGDGWGYDIGFGGLDHVLASGMDISKSPEEMFDLEIENDLKAVDTRIREYWSLSPLTGGAPDA